MRNKLEKGLSIIEVLVAVCMLGVLILPLTHLYLQSSGGIQLGQSETVVLNIGNSFTAQVRKFPPSTLPSTTGKVPLTPNANGKYQLGGPQGQNSLELPSWDALQYALTYEIIPLPTMPREARLVFLEIQWSAKIGGARVCKFPVIVGGDS